MNDDKSGFVMIPNEFFERWLPRLSGPETKISLCVIRKTFGFDKDRDSISAQQISVGTGMKRTAVFEGLRGLVEKGFLRRFSEAGNVTSYQVVGIRPVRRTVQVPVRDSERVNSQPVRNPEHPPVRPTERVSPEPVRKTGQARVRALDKPLKQPKGSLQQAYPKSVERMRELGDLYGASVDSLMERVFKRCAGHRDEDIADALEWKSHQRSPALWMQTVPENLERQNGAQKEKR